MTRVILFLLSIATSSAWAQTPTVPLSTVQQALKDRGFQVGKADGKWGPRSSQALQAFQKSQGLAPTGKPDDETLRRLLRPPAETTSPKSDPLPQIHSPATEPSRTEAVAPPPAANADSAEEPPPPPPPPAPAVAIPAGIAPTTASSHPNEVAPKEPVAPEMSPRKKAGFPAEAGALLVALLLGTLAFIVVVPTAYAFRRRRLATAKHGQAAGPKPLMTPEALPPIRLDDDLPSRTEQTPIRCDPSTSSIIVADKDPLQAAIASYDAALNNALSRHITPVQVSSAVPQTLVAPLANDAHLVKRAQSSSAQTPGSMKASYCWVSAGTSVAIQGIQIEGGLIYVGRSLPRQSDGGPDNCLINPSLTVGSTSDVQGSFMSYWPSYSEMAPTSRRAFLTWLAGPRDDPATYIGYIFLYLYGLERRLILEDSGPERPTLVAEVLRLLSVYGGHHSFRRYASLLLEADALRHGSPESPVDFSGSRYGMSLHLLSAMGQKALERQPIEPELLLQFIRFHPETRVRTPAQRAFSELGLLFRQEVERRYPGGVLVKARKRLPVLEATYQAASGSFRVNLLPQTLQLPDVSGLAEPFGTLRAIFEDCSSALDAYSRELGRSPGLRPNLAVVSRLPASLRLAKARTLDGDPLAAIENLADRLTPVLPADFVARLGIPVSPRIDKGVLREWARILGAFGFGMTADPAFALRAFKPDLGFVVFALGAEAEAAEAPSDAFRAVQTLIVLGAMAGLADGTLDAAELEHLETLCRDTPGLSVAERNRLRAEIRVYAQDPLSRADLRQRLRAVPTADRDRLANVVIDLLTIDGIVDPREVSFVEQLFDAMGLQRETIYSRLHARVGPRSIEAEAAPVASATTGSTPSVPLSRGNALDPARLAAIRAETAGAASLLSDIFTDDPDEVDPPAESLPEEAPDELVDGLEGRYHAFLLDLCSQPEWTAAVFERLARAAGLLPGAAVEALNSWALDRYDDLIIEGEDPLLINTHLLPSNTLPVTA